MKVPSLYVYNYLFFLLFAIGCVHSVRGASESRELSGKSSQQKPPVKKSQGIAHIKEVMGKYRLSSGVSMSLRKRVYLALMEDEKTVEGQALLSKGRLRLELKRPDHSLLVISPETLWIESRFNGDIQVSKVSMSGKNRRKGLIGIFFDQESIWDGYRLVGVKTKKNSVEYVLKPTKKNRRPEAKKIKISIDRKAGVVDALTYWDDLDNRTAFLFKDVKFDIKPTADKFKYVPPKGVDVTEY
ncbi:outer-membrane lipoprotein carrier protein LolA [Bdellovibrionales bacterium]|nr:outer-membrane lipoprotein carrier protein LolA [Bdellovibrionales bacterium]